MATQTDSTLTAPRQPAAAAQPTAPTPLALRLPDEVWFLVLVNLEYCALKRAQRICKRVQRLIQDESLDDKLFRLGPVDGELKVGMHFKLHPHIEKTDPVKRSRWFSVLADEAWEYHSARLTPWSYPALTDFATSPACTRLKVRVAPTLFYDAGENKHTHVCLERSAGVRVGDVFEALGGWFDEHAPKYVVRANYVYAGLAEKPNNDEMVGRFYFEGRNDLVVRAAEGKRPKLSVYLEASIYE